MAIQTKPNRLIAPFLVGVIGLLSLPGCNSDRNAQVEKLGKLFDEYHEIFEDRQKAPAVEAAITALLSGHVGLTDGGSLVYRSTTVNFCSDLSGAKNLQCMSALTGADDTAHIREFPHTVVRADPNLTLHFVDSNSHKVRPIKVAYTLSHHSSKLESLPTKSDGTFSLADLLKQDQVTLATITEIKPHGYVKHVWILESLLL